MQKYVINTLMGFQGLICWVIKQICLIYNPTKCKSIVDSRFSGLFDPVHVPSVFCFILTPLFLLEFTFWGADIDSTLCLPFFGYLFE